MSPRKLSDADKQEIISLYKETEETTSTLATRYGVSSSTISRFLKSNLSEVEYEDLIQQKRLARTPHREQTSQLELDKQLELSIEQSSDRSLQEESSEEESNNSTRWKRRRSSAPFHNEEIEEIANTETIEKIEEIKPIEEKVITTKITKEIKPIASGEAKPELSVAEAKELERVEAFTLGAMLGEDMADIDEDDDDLEDDDFDDDEDWALEIKPNLVRTKTKNNVDVKVLPLSKAALPKTCYLVVDRLAELIVLPMKDFADLGSIPDEEIKQKTLPIFDNHRVARRFSNRSQRVIKVPDSQMLQKTSSHLQAKGITRLLLDGQIYSLISVV
jgi:transposase-like protein